ncbi:hypothetical protein [Corallococcus sp. CA047B]|uniref:hypothetical protein n=1 Tax=Corallococcus sp. CA047B TaxID=2316729 RepID=UPI0011C4934C|nr:hypothetical protein [Corallococcus sp. CA047B]
MRFQPALEAVLPLPHEEAESIALKAAQEQLLLEDPKHADRGSFSWHWVGSFELTRCWAFLLYDGPNIPPGLAVVVDKHSHESIVWRYIDVAIALEKAGFDVTPAQGHTLRAAGSWRPPSRQPYED